MERSGWVVPYIVQRKLADHIIPSGIAIQPATSISEGISFVSFTDSLETCREKALRLLENSPHSVSGLKRKLFNAGKFTAQDIKTVIDDLLKARLLDDAQFAANYIDYLKTTGIGRFKAVFKLKNKGVPQHIIQEAMEKYWGTEEGDDERAAEAAKIKWRSLKTKKDWPEIKKLQAVARFLAGRGFPMDVIRRVLERLKVS